MIEAGKKGRRAKTAALIGRENEGAILVILVTIRTTTYDQREVMEVEPFV